MLSAEKIEKNYKLFVTLCNKLGDRSEPINKMIEHLDERLAFSPASSRLAFHAAYPGGFIEHSLNVLRNARKLNDIYEFNNEPLYLDQDSDWHREKLGQMYKINENIQKMPNAERGLWLLQHFGVKLTLDEWIAIRTNDGPVAEENRVYAMCEPKLAIIVHQADRMACEQEKDIAKS